MHPAVTSTIIGPKTMDQLDDLLGAADVTLDAATLDRIDEIVRARADASRTRRRLRLTQSRGFRPPLTPPPTALKGTTMEHRRLGRTALRVSELCLGTMNFGPLTPKKTRS